VFFIWGFFFPAPRPPPPFAPPPPPPPFAHTYTHLRLVLSGAVRDINGYLTPRNSLKVSHCVCVCRNLCLQEGACFAFGPWNIRPHSLTLVAVRSMQKCVVWSMEHQTTLPDSRGGPRNADACCLDPGTSDHTP